MFNQSSGYGAPSPQSLDACKAVPVERELDRLDDCLLRLASNFSDVGFRLAEVGDRLFGPVPEAPVNAVPPGLISKDPYKVDAIWKRVRDLELIAETLMKQAQRLSVL